MAIVVVGSLHLDLVVRVRRMPEPGETVLGLGHFRTPGGKGGNQAAAVGRLGQRVAMVGQVGDDADGETLRAALEGAGVDTTHVAVSADLPSGLAVVTVDERGENAIVVSAGASGALAVEQVERAAGALGAAAVTLLSVEVPVEAVARAAELAGGTVVLNPAPAQPLPPALLRRADVLVPNRGELGALTGGGEPRDLAAVEERARSIDGPKAVVVSLGADGALVVPAGGAATHCPAPAVEVVDTTGAGDALCGAIADGLARGLALEEAVDVAVRAAALSTTRWGAQAALPTREEVDAFTPGTTGRAGAAG